MKAWYAKRLKGLEKENSPLKKELAKPELDKVIWFFLLLTRNKTGHRTFRNAHSTSDPSFWQNPVTKTSVALAPVFEGEPDDLSFHQNGFAPASFRKTTRISSSNEAGSTRLR